MECLDPFYQSDRNQSWAQWRYDNQVPDDDDADALDEEEEEE